MHIQRSLRAILALLLASAAAFTVDAAIPAGYYTSLQGKKGAELKDAAYRLVRNFTTVSSYSALPQYFQVTDVYPNSRRWWDMYSNIPLYAPSFSGLNREHSFPKSWWGGLTDVTAYVDLNHLYPSEAAANMAKSNYPLGTVDRSSKLQFDNGVTTVGYAVPGQGGGARYVFEPDDEYKGDFARTYFYMVTCYQDLRWSQQYMYMLQQNTYPTLNDWAVQLLLQWSRQDPVSQKEIDRNEAVYSFQNNRNPFIDFPSLAEYIWGNKLGEPFDIVTAGGETPGITGDPTLITPSQGTALDFGQVAIGKSVTAQLFFHGEYLTGDLSLLIYTGDKKMFSIPSKTIATYLINSDNGYWLNITYTPTETGKHESRLLISDGGIDGSRGVVLKGECLDVPVLHAPTATAATDITAYSYMANWEAFEGDVVDYYVVTRTITSGGTTTQDQILAEGCNVLVEDFDKADQESYHVQSVRLGYMSDPSNEIYVDHAGIQGVEADRLFTVLTYEGGFRFVSPVAHTGLCVYDVAGRLYSYIPEVQPNDEIELPLGVYFISTDQCAHPVRILIK